MNRIDLERCETFEDFCKMTGTNGKKALELLLIELERIQKEIQDLKRKKGDKDL